MKAVIGKNGENGAVVLTTTICTFALLSFLVVGYLWMMMEQSKATERSEHWNSALAVAEAGIDEGMAHINWSFGTNVNLATNGWALDTTGNYYSRAARSIPGGAYSVIISNTLMPTVISTATMTDKMNTLPIRRTVEVTTAPLYAFTRGLTAITNSPNSVYFKGSQVVVTSDVASVHGSINDNSGGKIYGNVFTGPDGTLNTNKQSVVESYTNNFYESYPDVQAPYTFGTTPPTPPQTGNVTLSGNNTQYFFNGNYSVNGSIIVAGANTVLYVTKNFSADSISNEPGASFTLYVGSDDTSVSTTATFGKSSGSGGINASAAPTQFSYFGLPNNATIDLKNGLTAISGSFYAPEANMVQEGNMSFYGGLLCNSYTANGNVVFRYDPDLAKKGPVIGYTVASWKEIPPP